MTGTELAASAAVTAMAAACGLEMAACADCGERLVPTSLGPCHFESGLYVCELELAATVTVGQRFTVIGPRTR